MSSDTTLSYPLVIQSEGDALQQANLFIDDSPSLFYDQTVSFQSISHLIWCELEALRERKRHSHERVDYLSDDAIHWFPLSFFSFYENLLEYSLPQEFFIQRFYRFLHALRSSDQGFRIGLEKELVLSHKGRPLEEQSLECFISEIQDLPEFASVSFSFEENRGWSALEYKNKDTIIHKDFSSAYQDLSKAEQKLYHLFKERDWKPVPPKKQRNLGADIHIHYGYPSFEDRINAFLAVRDFLPELVIMTAENTSFFARSYRLKKRFTPHYLISPPTQFYHFFLLSEKTPNFLAFNPLLFSYHGSLEVRVIDALSRLEDQKEVLFAVDELMHILKPPQAWDKQWLKRWRYAMGKGTHYVQTFSHRKNYLMKLFDNLSFVPKQFLERLGL